MQPSTKPHDQTEQRSQEPAPHNINVIALLTISVAANIGLFTAWQLAHDAGESAERRFTRFQDDALSHIDETVATLVARRAEHHELSGRIAQLEARLQANAIDTSDADTDREVRNARNELRDLIFDLERQASGIAAGVGYIERRLASDIELITQPGSTPFPGSGSPPNLRLAKAYFTVYPQQLSAPVYSWDTHTLPDALAGVPIPGAADRGNGKGVRSLVEKAHQIRAQSQGNPTPPTDTNR